jgi:hypothetical protein
MGFWQHSIFYEATRLEKCWLFVKVVWGMNEKKSAEEIEEKR